MPYQDSVDVGFETLREVAFGDVDATYTLIGSLFTRDIVYLHLKNKLDQPIYISKDGTNNVDELSAGEIWVWDLSSNRFASKPLLFPKLTGLYQKHTGVAPTSGKITLTTVYGS